MPKPTKPTEKTQLVGLLGVAFDSDGHHRLTRGDHFVIYGGSAETHERMQEVTFKLAQKLKDLRKRTDKSVGDAPAAESP